MGCENSVKNSCGWYLSNSDKLLLLPDKEPRVVKCVESAKKEEFQKHDRKTNWWGEQTNECRICL